MRLPQSGDFVLVTQGRYVSGNSSIPMAEIIGEALGELRKIDEKKWAVVDQLDESMLTIDNVYSAGESMVGKLLIQGWVKGEWGYWEVEK